MAKDILLLLPLFFFFLFFFRSGFGMNRSLGNGHRHIHDPILSSNPNTRRPAQHRLCQMYAHTRRVCILYMLRSSGISGIVSLTSSRTHMPLWLWPSFAIRPCLTLNHSRRTCRLIANLYRILNLLKTRSHLQEEVIHSSHIRDLYTGSRFPANHVLRSRFTLT